MGSRPISRRKKKSSRRNKENSFFGSGSPGPQKFFPHLPVQRPTHEYHSGRTHIAEKQDCGVTPISPSVSLFFRLQLSLHMFRKTFTCVPKNEGDILNITPEIEATVRESGVVTGLAGIFVAHSTAAVTTIEYEPGVLSDLRRALSVLAPDKETYAHDSRWGDGNGRSHVKAALVGPSLTVPVEGGELLLGTWQQVVLLELDIHGGRTRTVIVTVSG